MSQTQAQPVDLSVDGIKIAKKRIKFIALMMFLFIMAAGGASVYFLGEQSKVRKVTKDIKINLRDPTEKFVKLDPIMLPVIDAAGVRQTISIVVVIEARSPETADKIKLVRPRLNDAFLQDMYGRFARAENLDNGIVNVDSLKSRLLSVSRDIVGESLVSGVLLQVIQQRPS